MAITNEVDTMVEANAGFERVGRSFWADASWGIVRVISSAVCS